MLFMLCSCQHEINESYFFYFNGTHDMNKQLSLKDWEELSSKADYNDTLYFNGKMKSLIIEKLMLANRQPSNPNTYDIVLGIHIDSIDFYLNRTNNNCWIRKHKGRYEYAKIPDEATWFLKWKSGYFNTIPLEDLEDDASIKKYGIPRDYKYVINQKKKECTKALVTFTPYDNN